MDQIFDLFGDPVPANWGQRGRPEHIASQKNRNLVSMLVAWGWSNPRIAAALYITQPTLRKHYFSELKFREVARDRHDAQLGAMLLQQGANGNVAATKLYFAMVEKNDRMEIERTMGADDKQPAQIGRVGKKIADAQRAEAADADLMAELDQEADNQNAVH
ncbi:hypothetical protein [Bradyrhizobium guangdongense]|uniref:hypothetical protein n=1 Tax=Bradyrhizobium guangdongense TaxID=1325090 RepID=UPI0018F7DD87|nr:hypothetical protein [Bradyrhizobium guangdongense]